MRHSLETIMIVFVLVILSKIPAPLHGQDIPQIYGDFSEIDLLIKPDLSEFKTLDLQEQMEIIAQISKLQSDNVAAQTLVKAKSWRRFMTISDKKCSLNLIDLAFSSQDGSRCFENHYFRLGLKEGVPWRVEDLKATYGYFESSAFQFTALGYSGDGFDEGYFEEPRVNQQSPTGLDYKYACNRLSSEVDVFWEKFEGSINAGTHAAIFQQNKNLVAVHLYNPAREKDRGRFWVFDLAQNGCCLFYKNGILPGRTLTWETKFHLVDKCYLPISVKHQETKEFADQPVMIQKHTELDFFDVSNQAFDAEVFSIKNFPWKTLDVVIEDKRAGRNRRIAVKDVVEE